MELHNAYVGRNISSHDDLRLLPWLPGYTASLDAHTFHEVVCKDPGVSHGEREVRSAHVGNQMPGGQSGQLGKRAGWPVFTSRGWRVVEETGRWWLRMISLGGKEHASMVERDGLNCKHTDLASLHMYPIMTASTLTTA